MTYFLSIILFLYSFVINAGEIFPKGCEALTVHEELIKLSAEKPTLVMLHNLSNMNIWVTHPVSDPGPSAGFSSLIKAGNWSALALDKKSFELSCIESRPGHEQQIPCKDLLAACQWPSVNMPKSEAGTFWAGEDMSLSALTAHVGSRGFVLPTKRE